MNPNSTETQYLSKILPICISSFLYKGNQIIQKVRSFVKVF
nr:MAG TPA: hypothetical protein [Caudoviricetes sp.]DAR69302.1 MAG TPA: hypothetical protein [Caudoviricetes sp.]